MRFKRKQISKRWWTLALLVSGLAFAAYRDPTAFRNALSRIADLADIRGRWGPGSVAGASSSKPGEPAAVVPPAYSLTATTLIDEIAQNVAIGDVTGDGRADLVAIIAEPLDFWHISIYVQTPGGTLAAPLKFQFPDELLNSGSTGLALADLNEDGRKDIVFTTAYTGGVDLLLSTPGGGFYWSSDRWDIRRPTTQFLVTDANRDGHLDITMHVAQTTSNYLSEQFLSYFGDGTGKFPNHSRLLTRENEGVDLALGDINSDGFDDLVSYTSMGLDYGINARLHDGGFAFGSPNVIYRSGLDTFPQVAVADMTGDARADVIAHNSLTGNSRNRILVLPQTQGGTISTSAIKKWDGSFSPVQPRNLQTSDLNADGKQDVLYTLDSFDSVFYMLQRPGGLEDVVMVPLPGTTTSADASLATGDLNGDGIPDAAVALGYDGLVVCLGKLAAFTGAGGVPGAPTIGSATLDPSQYNGSDAYAVVIKVPFSAPANNGGNPITGYTVHAVPDGIWDMDAGTTLLTHTIAQLDNNQDYQFYVTANNAAGTSPPSALSNVVQVRDPALVYVREGNGMEGNYGISKIPVKIELSRPALRGGLSFDMTPSSGTATAGVDFVARTDRINIPEGASFGTYFVDVIGDKTPEYSEFLTVSISNVSGFGDVKWPAATVTIGDTDPAPDLLTVTGYFAKEGNGGMTTGALGADLGEALDHDVTFDIANSGGSATPSVDFVPFNFQALRIPAGQTHLNIPISFIGDADIESDESIIATVANVSGAAYSGYPVYSYILEDDLPILHLSNASVTEGSSGRTRVSMTAYLDEPFPYGAVPFQVETMEGSGTATAGVDYPARLLNGLAIPLGQTSTSFDLEVNGDTSFEANETFQVRAINATSVTPGDPATVTILNDDIANGISVDDAQVVEGDSGSVMANFTVRLSKAQAGAVSFDLYTSPGTAAPGIDFQDVSANGLVIPPGALSTSFSVPVLGDTKVEQNETFALNLNNVSGATVTDGQGQGTIKNDDKPRLSINDIQVVEGDDGLRSAFFRVSISEPTTYSVRFDVESDMMAPTYYNDYMASYKDLTIDAGRTSVQYEVQIRGDTEFEGNQYFNILVLNVQHAIAEKDVGVGTILDDDPPPATAAPTAVKSKGALRGRSGKLKPGH